MDLQLELLAVYFADYLQDVLLCQLNNLLEDLLKGLQMLLHLDFKSVEKQAHL